MLEHPSMNRQRVISLSQIHKYE